MTEYIVDIVLLAVFVLITVKYSVKGFAKTILNFAAFFAAIVLSWSSADGVTDWVFSNTSLFAGTEKSVARLIILVAVFAALSLLLNWLISLIDKIFKVPVLKQANKLLGALLGALCGAIAVFVLCVSLSFLADIIYNAKFVNAVDSSQIVSFAQTLI